MPLVTTTEMFKKPMKAAMLLAFQCKQHGNRTRYRRCCQRGTILLSCKYLQVRKYAKHIYLVKLVEAALEDSNLPIALHLDHGDSFEICKDCVDGGFTSVMIDASHHDFDENVKILNKLLNMLMRTAL